MSDKIRVVVVCDATPAVGLGHVSRQIGLAHELISAGAEVVFLSGEIPDQLRESAISVGIEVICRASSFVDAVFLEEMENLGPQVIVVDSYEVPGSLFEQWRSDGITVVVFDDDGLHGHAPCQLLINPNFNASQDLYPSSSGAEQRLLGIKWAILRPEIVAARTSLPATRSERVFISLGGTDVSGLSQDLAEAVARRCGVPVETSSQKELHVRFTAREMADRMLNSQVGVVTCSTVALEAMHLGMPFVGLVVAHNQVMIGDALAASGIADVIDARSECDCETIATMVETLFRDSALREKRRGQGMRLIDGNGASRVARRVLSLAEGMS